jgi:anti-anti-sigma factor
MQGMKGLEITVEDKSGAHIVHAGGYIDTTTAGLVEKAIESAVAAKKYRIVIDLTGTDYISSAGWGIFVGYKKVLMKSKGDIKLSNMKAEVLEVYDVLDFTHILDYYPSIDKAIESFGAKK